MIRIMSAQLVTEEMLDQLKLWFDAEWGNVDPIDRTHQNINVPTPLVAVDDQAAPVGGLAYTSSVQPLGTDIALWINMVWVSPEHRKRGVASQLVRSAAAEAAHAGASELYVLSDFPLLYEKLGWQRVETDAPEKDIVLRKCL